MNVIIITKKRESCILSNDCQVVNIYLNQSRVVRIERKIEKKTKELQLNHSNRDEWINDSTKNANGITVRTTALKKQI